MNQTKSSTKIAGIDVGKKSLEVAIGEHEAIEQFTNDAAGHDELVSRLIRLGVGRVGIEATGGYERAICTKLQAVGVEVVLHQPLEVRLFARLNRQRAKTDRLDARLIAAATAQRDGLKAAADPRLAELAERLTAYEQATDLVSQPQDPSRAHPPARSGAAIAGPADSATGSQKGSGARSGEASYGACRSASSLRTGTLIAGLRRDRGARHRHRHARTGAHAARPTRRSAWRRPVRARLRHT